MQKNRTTKLMCLLIAFVWTTIVVGSSYAYFIDSVSVNGNVVTTGNLQAEMLWSDDMETWHDAEDTSKGTIFSGDRWEPNYTDVKYIQIKNTGSLAFQYRLDVIPTLSQTNPGYKLGEVIEAYVDVVDGNYIAPNGYKDFADKTPSGTIASMITSDTGAYYGTLLKAQETITLAVALHMQHTADNEYQGLSVGDGFNLRLYATQTPFEYDSFGNTYDESADSAMPKNEFAGGSASGTVSVVNGVTTTAVNLSGGAVQAYVPAGVKVNDGVTKLALSVTVLEESQNGIKAGKGESLLAVDVHVDGLSANNTVPLKITLSDALAAGLNVGNTELYHVENGKKLAMTQVLNNAELNAHNQYYYNPVNGTLTLNMATFSEVDALSEVDAAWNGEVATAFGGGTGTENDPYIIANADQLAYLGEVVSNDNANYGSKHYKLIAGVNIGGIENYNTAGRKVLWYPIGYNKVGGTTTDKGNWYTYGGSFKGVFDGAGHTISGIYQNTWAMVGDYDGTYYNDAMGLFGYVNGGTVKNLTIDNFYSEGEFAPTGCVTAYAAGEATFENIAITNSHPQTYNTGVAGIVGWDEGDESNFTFKNITVDSTNTISALWGSWDVAAAGLLGYLSPNSKAKLENCHVSATIDVYNDVCGNYQYYWYRYSGMLIGTVDKTDAKGNLDLSNISATNCTVDFGDRHEYYYCEFVKNSMASYTHDYQFSRVANDDIVGTGDSATCKNHNHGERGYENVNGESVLVEDKQAVYIPYRQVFGGYGWGVKGTEIDKRLEIEDITVEVKPGTTVEKFETNFTGGFLYRVGNQNTVSVGSLFKAKDGATINKSGVWVSIDKVDENSNASGKFNADKNNWANGTIQFSGTGVVKVTIQDYEYCKPTELLLEVVDATNITSAAGATNKNVVLLKNVEYSGDYLYYANSTLYGNGFTIDITGAKHSDLRDASDTNSNKNAYCNIWMVDSRFDNVRITGSVYPKVGMTADSDYGNAAIRTGGDCYITNSYISNCRVPLRVQGNTTLIDTVVDGGRYANIELRSGKLTLDGVTTINTVRKGSDGATDVIGFGIVIHDEATNANIAVIGDGLKQHNWAGEDKHKKVLSGDLNLQSAYNLVFNSANSDTIYFKYNNDRYVNTGILCLCPEMNEKVVTGLNDRYYQAVSGYDAWVLTYDNSKHTAWFNESVAVENVNVKAAQYPVIPNYTGNEAQTVEFTKGETYEFDTSVLKAEKFGQNLTISSVVMNDTKYNYGDKIPFTEGGVYEIVYTVVDPYIYNADGSAGDKFTHKVGITVTAISKDAEILAPKFTFIDQNGNKYESTTVKAGDKTYVMPNVSAADPTTNAMSSINIGSASINGTTVYFPVAKGYTVRSGSNFNRYYPLFNGINITDYTIAGDTTGTTYTTSGNYTSLVGSSDTKFIIPANGGQTNCGDYVKTDGQAGNAAGNSDSGWQGAGYSTSYNGTYLKSGNTSASSGADKNGYERIVWVEYCFNAGNGDVYYYRIGYHCNKESAQSCVTPDTLVTLANGSKKEIQHVTYEDQLLVWDFYKGEYAAVPSAIIFNHGEEENTVIALTFDDGTVVKVVNMHLFVDADTNSFVMIDADNADSYIGHSFVKRDGESYKTVKLTNVDVKQEMVVAYGIISAQHYNILVEDMFSADYEPQDVKLFTYFDIGDNMKYDEQKMQADIEEYGLYTYEEFSDYLTYEQFEAFNVKYMKVAVGKGEYTYEGILQLIEEYLK